MVQLGCECPGLDDLKDMAGNTDRRTSAAIAAEGLIDHFKNAIAAFMTA